MIQIIGDEIQFEGYRAGRISTALPPTVRDRLQDVLEGRTEDEAEIETLRADICAMEDIEGELTTANEELENENERLRDLLRKHGIEAPA